MQAQRHTFIVLKNRPKLHAISSICWGDLLLVLYAVITPFHIKAFDILQLFATAFQTGLSNS